MAKLREGYQNVLQGRRILIVEDDPGWWEKLRVIFQRAGAALEWRRNRTAAIEAIRSGKFDLVALDLDLGFGVEEGGLGVLRECAGPPVPGYVRILSKPAFVVVTGIDHAMPAAEAIRLGAAGFMLKPKVDGEEHLLVELVRSIVARGAEFEAMRTEVRRDIIHASAAMAEVLRRADSFAASSLPVLIRGESGVGKEPIARRIHLNSRRSSGPFVAQNFGALSSTRIEDDLFGHEPEAFTDARHRRRGLFERANDGTLFLDEIGTLPVELQHKLLRVLQEEQFERLGGQETINVDVRIVSATNADLEDLMRQGLFREDLYHRLNAAVIRIPPLRDRPDDILPLAEHFARIAAARDNLSDRRISSSAMQALQGYPWPGNVRELKNIMGRSLVLAQDADEIEPDHLGLGDLGASTGRATNVKGPGGRGELTRKEALDFLASRFLEPSAGSGRVGLEDVYGAINTACRTSGSKVGLRLPKDRKDQQTVLRTIVKLIDEHRLQQQELANILGVTSQCIRNWHDRGGGARQTVGGKRAAENSRGD